MRPPPVAVSRALMRWTPGRLWHRLPDRLKDWIVDGWMLSYGTVRRLRGLE